jgi:hypothetical protein
MKIKKVFYILFFSLACLAAFNSQVVYARNNTAPPNWTISVLPSSIRLNLVTDKILDIKASTYPSQRNIPRDLLKKNWIYDGKTASLHGARGEYVSFQIVLTNHTDSTLKNISVHIERFTSKNGALKYKSELFLEWGVHVETKSTGYPKASLGTGWYPDALIPFKYIQEDTSEIKRRWIYPLWLPDFNNRIKYQKSLVVWVDQYIPFHRRDAKPGEYDSKISVTVGQKTRNIPVHLKVWDFAIPFDNKFEASLQQGFLKPMNAKLALKVRQLFRRNRICLMDPTYKPGLSVSKEGKVKLDWHSFDKRLKKYFTGKAFTTSYGYDYGPGFGEPIKAFILPFNVYGKYGTRGWPDIGNPSEERKPENRAIYTQTIKKVRNHLREIVNPKKTDLIVYLNGLDESYFPEAWDRMAYYGKMFHKYYPEAHFRIDGAYGKKAMKRVHKYIDYWSAHTVDYNIKTIRKYRKKWGIKDWLYGPMIYESKVNSWVGSSTFIDLPLVNDRAISWSSWKYGTYSWLDWGIGAGWKRAWYDPETWKQAYRKGADTDSTYTSKKLNGNALLVYSPGIVPNVSGPCPSIRLKTMRDGLQEYEYMKKLSELDGNKKRANKVVSSIIDHPFGRKSIGHLNVWNYNVEKWDKARIKLGKMINQVSKKDKGK